jgi:hypothetical protein
VSPELLSCEIVLVEPVVDAGGLGMRVCLKHAHAQVDGSALRQNETENW